jgi:hypothetical protein
MYKILTHFDPFSDSAAEKSTTQRGDSQRRKGDHIPMHKRLTERKHKHFT